MQAVLRIEGLPANALDAAAEFHRTWLELARSALRGGAKSLVLILPPAPPDHRDWRRGVARDLARELAPGRVNLVAGSDPDAVSAALEYLADAPGVTGQLLPVSARGADAGRIVP